MNNVFKNKSKKSGQWPRPSIRVEIPPPELPREGSFRHKVKEGLQNLFSIQPSHSRDASKGPSERAKSQEYLPVSDNTANPSIGDENRFVEIKNDPGESVKPVNREMGSFDRTCEDTEDLSVNFPMAPQESIQASKRQAQVKCTIDEDVFREKSQQLDKGKGRDEGPDGVGELAVPGHPRQDYDASQLHGAHHFSIGGNTRFENIGVKNEYNHAGTYDLSMLKDFVSFNAFHNSSAQDPTRRVHPGTRQRVLRSIRDWIDTPSAKERIFWLHGPAGVGKSAIAQTIARSCVKGKLAATFFFFRSDPSRNDGNRLFTTLAWQFASTIPATKNALIHSLIECPDIPMRDIETQFEELIVKPFLALKGSGVELSAPVVIVDGVDECSDDSLQRRFLKIIGNAVKDDRIPLRFLICSRSEAHIQDTIDIFRSIALSLDLAKLDDANQDIEKYLRAEFSRIASEQDLDPAWPGEQIIQEFVYKASGQFVYASTVIKYVGDEYSSAETQLDIIRGLKPASSISPFAELDELYKEILRRQRDPVFLKDCLSLLVDRNGIVLNNGYDFPDIPGSPTDLHTPLNKIPTPDYLHQDYPMLLNVSKKEFHRKLRGMHSLLKFEPHIDIHHRSFLDFLQDSSRSGQYHISKLAGTRRYLDLIAASLVRYASTVIEGHDDHKTHFSPAFHRLSSRYRTDIVLPVEEWQQALQPLLDLQSKLLTLPNFRSTWELLPCEICTGFHTIRDLLLHLAFLSGASDHVINSSLMAESHADESEEMHGSVTPSITTETDTNTPEKDLNVCLSSLLHRLRRGKSLGTETIQLVCSLLCFDHTEIAMRLGSISNAQNLLDAIDELINNKSFCSDYSPDISRKAVRLALEIYTRVPVFPRSLLSKGSVDPHHDVWRTCHDFDFHTELLFQTVFMSRILDPSYIMRVSWVYGDNILFPVVGKVNETNEPLKQWRGRSKPSSITRIRVMLQVAKALRYFHSMDIVLHSVEWDDIFLDLKSHPRFWFRGLITYYAKVTSIRYLGHLPLSPEANVFSFGCLFYEMCFDVEISYSDRNGNDIKAVAKRLSKPEIRDDVWELIQRCCANEPTSRPTMDDVVREMETWDMCNLA